MPFGIGRQGRGDLLTAEYRDELVYFCQDGPFHGLTEQRSREEHWWYWRLPADGYESIAERVGRT